MRDVLDSGEIEFVKRAGLIVRECLDILEESAREGVNTKSLDEIAYAFIISHKAKPAFLGYMGYPASICTSRNCVVVHGIPGENDILEEGDILSIDVGVEFQGYFADGAKTFKIGRVCEAKERLVDVTEKALYIGINEAKAGSHLSNISYAIQSFVEDRGFSVVRAFVGHGTGRHIHQKPEIPNFGNPNRGCILENGMVLAIEPMVNIGTYEVEILEDGWTAVTKDRRASCHFEHTIIVNDDKPEIVT